MLAANHAQDPVAHVGTDRILSFSRAMQVDEVAQNYFLERELTSISQHGCKFTKFCNNGDFWFEEDEEDLVRFAIWT